MDIKQLKYLIALDETRHFGKAASQCNITQPTLSMRIRSLEEELGLVLIVRGQRFEGFTPEGERILAWARALLAAHDGLQAEAALCKGQVVGELTSGDGAAGERGSDDLYSPADGKIPGADLQPLFHVLRADCRRRQPQSA
jgi:DNA-binding transcriptional LysR family regulator